MNAVNPNPNGDLLLEQPADTVSAVAWSPAPQASGTSTVHLLAASSWDGNILCYRVSTEGQFEATRTAAHKAPVLDVAWANDGSKVFSASCDNTVMSWDFGGQQGTQVAAHDAPVKFVRHVNTAQGYFLVTGGWDNTLKWWDGRTAQPTQVVNLPAAAHAAAFNERLGVVCTSNRRVLIFDLRKGLQPITDIESPLKYPTRSVATFALPEGFSLGSVEGRIQMLYLNLDAPSVASLQVSAKCFAYKYHRDVPPAASQPTIVHSVNCLSTYQGDVFITGGSDGLVTFWHKGNRTRLGELQRHPSPIIATSFSPDGKLLAYAAGYDWHKGIEYNNPKTYPNALLVHAVTQNDLVEKKSTTGRR